MVFSGLIFQYMLTCLPEVKIKLQFLKNKFQTFQNFSFLKMIFILIEAFPKLQFLEKLL